ncbi:glycosyltransferase family 4 protein [Maritimibacter dapengensis]|uniref:Glycosyltransferase family 4 protein n=1 Tax=Maritimibacter dapengensis TaxID=2836868 RepID=A0ABS6T4E8_9RHOB|nr:glycosyltransferase family 1 protein [Maritimibacter dapengensis]MBV7380119.1 glycosyltransferase family 4 protein [Maritimibacter dapengensis]
MTEAARLIDLSRLVSRVGRPTWTGIDRVEAAYLKRFLSENAPLFALVRSSFGFTLFDREGVGHLAQRILGDVPWGEPDILTKVFMRPGTGRRGAEADLRRFAIARTGRRTLGQTFAKHLPRGTIWFNVGHSNLVASVFDNIHESCDGHCVVLVHDTIPLDHPHWQREGTVSSFEARMRQVAAKADLVIHTSNATRGVTEAQFERFGRVPPGEVARLGIERPTPDKAQIPIGLRLDRPYFVALGTIEPRKNHAMLLNAWAAMRDTMRPDAIPQLFIVGARGWNNAKVFARLDLEPSNVVELGPLSDGATASLIAGAHGLLMPSFVEGFGLPPGEALSLGTKVLASDLPVYREVFGNNVIYLDPEALYPWVNEIQKIARKEREALVVTGKLPTWEAHFNIVLNCL